MNKRALLKKIVARLEEELASFARAARAALDEATDPQSKAENKYDTRGLEAAYLAGAQSRQAAETQTAIEKFANLTLKEFGPAEAIDLSAYVELDTRSGRTCLFIGPAKGGLEVEHDGREVVVITPQAPLGEQLIGRKMGDRFKWGAGASATDYRIIAVA